MFAFPSKAFTPAPVPSPELEKFPEPVRPVSDCPPGPNAPIISPVSPPVEVSSGRVLDPATSSPAESRNTWVPLITLPGPPGISVAPPISTAAGLAVIPLLVMVVIPCLEISVSSANELVPIKRADAPSDIAVPDMVKGGESGNSIVPAIEMPFESGKIFWPFRLVVCPGLHGYRLSRVIGVEFVPIIKFNGPSDRRCA